MRIGDGMKEVDVGYRYFSQLLASLYQSTKKSCKYGPILLVSSFIQQEEKRGGDKGDGLELSLF